jgi:hypothetical protein
MFDLFGGRKNFAFLLVFLASLPLLATKLIDQNIWFALIGVIFPTQAAANLLSKKITK